MSKIGKNTRLGSGDVPSIPNYNPGGDDFYVIKKYRSDDEYEMEEAERGLHEQGSVADE